MDSIHPPISNVQSSLRQENFWGQKQAKVGSEHQLPICDKNVCKEAVRATTFGNTVGPMQIVGHRVGNPLSVKRLRIDRVNLQRAASQRRLFFGHLPNDGCRRGRQRP